MEITEGEDYGAAAQMQAAAPHNTSICGKQRRRPERLGTAATEEQTRQLSPRERKKRQSQARFGLKKTFIREAGQWKVGTEQEGEEAD